MDLDRFTQMSRDELKTEWQKMFAMPPPARVGRNTLTRILICETQWRASGQSRAAMLRKLKTVLKAAEASKPIANSGARLIREWNGREHVVDVTADGYLWNGQTWRSLSAIAKEITGTKWSGPRFFGVAA